MKRADALSADIRAVASHSATRTAATAALGQPDPWQSLTALTAARIGLGRAGGSLPTRPLLQFQLAHARARDAVLQDLDVEDLMAQLAAAGFDALRLASAARDRSSFIARPDLGRILDDTSRRRLETRPPPQRPYDCVFVIADGLSAMAVQAHAVPLLSHLAARLGHDLGEDSGQDLSHGDWHLGPVLMVQQGRVAIGD